MKFIHNPRTALLFALLLTSWMLPCEAISEPHALNLDESFTEAQVSEYLSYYVDESDSSFEDILMNQEGFKPIQGNPDFGTIKGTLWVKFKVETNPEVPYFVELPFPLHRHVTLYRPVGSQEFESVNAGVFYPISNQEVPSKYPVFSLGESNGERFYYMSIQSIYPISANLKIYSQRAYIDYAKGEDLFFGVYVGVILVMALYNLFLFFAVRDTGYLYYAGTIIFCFWRTLPLLGWKCSRVSLSRFLVFTREVRPVHGWGG